MIAVPVERVEVRRNPPGDLVDQLEQHEWLTAFRRLARHGESAPARLRSLVAHLEDTLFDLTRSAHPWAVQNVLAGLGEAQAYLARSPAAREAVPPVPLLDEDWVRRASNGSDEFRIAAALAGLHAMAKREDGSNRPVLPMAAHFAPMNERRRWLEGRLASRSGATAASRTTCARLPSAGCWRPTG